MKKTFCLLLVILLFANSGAQVNTSVKGRVVNENNSPMAGAIVSVNDGNYFAVTDSEGFFRIPDDQSDSLEIAVSYVGYEKYLRLTAIPENGVDILISLTPERTLLEEVSIVSGISARIKKLETVSVEIADRDFISMHRGGSLMSSVNSIPGVSAIEIGSGHSKPLIRGLGFNRVVVIENGIRHEGQQWGADHGLEIDQYAVDRVEIVKGPASVMYGSDAIGGVMRVHQDPVPAANTLSGNIELSGRSNNNLLGGSAFLSGRNKSLFFTSRFTLLDYADYRIPADSVEIYSFHVPLHEGQLRNTAGNEMNIHASAGIIRPGIMARLSASHINSNSGFFANAHGLEPRMVNTELYDYSDRDIMFPSQEVSHLKLTGLVRFEKGIYRFESEAGFQNNFRQEKNNYVNHGYMPPVFPDDLGSGRFLEREFNKDIFSLNIRNFLAAGRRHNLSLGINSEYQDNRTGGYAFIIPDFRLLTVGAYLYDRISLGSRTNLHTGIRYDRGRVQTEESVDWFTTPVENSEDGGVEEEFLTRAQAIDRTFNSLSMSVGLNYTGELFSLRANIGKGYRMPTPKELAANGVNYHYFRYEKGNNTLEAEESWQADLNIEYNNTQFGFELSPFFNYFPGYIYLDPSYRMDYMYGAGNQIFEYTQNQVMRLGGEVRVRYDPARNVSAVLTGDYVYSEQLSGNKKGFTIPFSPPATLRFSMMFSPKGKGILQEPFAGFDIEYAGKQSRIVPPEKETAAYELVHLVAGTKIVRNNSQFEFSLRVHNLLNRRYLNHVSYYRLINAPEAGRNFIFSLKVPLFNNN
ncbi:MAG: TonB-dependent receptor [Bacteroidales bacterium]